MVPSYFIIDLNILGRCALCRRQRNKTVMCNTERSDKTFWRLCICFQYEESKFGEQDYFIFYFYFPLSPSVAILFNGFSFFKDMFIIENSNNRENKKDNNGTSHAHIQRQPLSPFRRPSFRGCSVSFVLMCFICLHYLFSLLPSITFYTDIIMLNMMLYNFFH